MSKVRIEGARSLEVKGLDPDHISQIIREALETNKARVEVIKRGPRVKAVVADEGSEAVPAE